MRGDSLRDLYAKSLALLGLAVLAAAGALFDYWPLTNEYPTVARLKLQPADAPFVPLPVPSELPAAPVMATRRAVRPAPTMPVAPPPAGMPAALAPAGPAIAVSPIVASAAPVRVRFGTPVSLAPLDVAAPEEPTLTSAPGVPPADVIVVEMMPIVAPARGDDDGSTVGFVTGALRKTGQTIKRTSARTGASIRDAIVSVGGAFRKLL